MGRCLTGQGDPSGCLGSAMALHYPGRRQGALPSGVNSGEMKKEGSIVVYHFLKGVVDQAGG